MNKEHVMLYCVLATEHGSFGGECVDCGGASMYGFDMRVQFNYCDYISRESNNFDGRMCRKCFDRKIKNKPLKRIMNYISMLRMNGKHIEKTTHEFYPYMPHPCSLIKKEEYD